MSAARGVGTDQRSTALTAPVCICLLSDGARVASSTGIDILLLDDFKLVINDTTHHVRPPRRGEGWKRTGTAVWCFCFESVDGNLPKTSYEMKARVCAFLWLLLRAAAARGGREAERCQVSGAAALHHPAHRGAPTRQRAGADWTTRGPQLSASPPGEGLISWKHLT